MKTIQVTQGSPEWLAHRANTYNASDAPAMLGCSPYKTRGELLREMSTGIAAEHDAATERRFADGHRFEALARPLAEAIVGEDLYPVTGAVDVPNFSRALGASFDGLTLMNDTAFEHKSLNDELRGCMGPSCIGRDLPLHYRVQMEQQLLVSGAERVLFMATRWAGDECAEKRHCWYTSDPALRAEILAGWKQFDADLAAYVPAEPSAPAAVAAPVESLPAVLVTMTGSLSVSSNLDAFGAALRTFIDRIPAAPSTDQEFADTDAACKALKRVEEALEAEDERALNGMADVATVRRVMADLRELARATRLQREKVVKARKDAIRLEIVQAGQTDLAKHVSELNAAMPANYMPQVVADFAGAIRGKKTVDSIRDAVATELARAKIECGSIANRIHANVKTIKESGLVVHDTAQLVLKSPEDLANVLAVRKAAEETRLEAIRQEERDRLAAEAAAPAPTPASAPVAAPAPSMKPADPSKTNAKPKKAKPSDREIIDVLTLHFRVHDSKVIEWLCAMDLEAASSELLGAM